MKKPVIILGIVTAIIAITLSASPYSNYAIVPLIIACISGIVLIYYSKKENTKIKPIQYIFILIIMTLGLIIYKEVYKSTTTEATESTEQLEPVNKDL